jgi:hypothetical protein
MFQCSGVALLAPEKAFRHSTQQHTLLAYTATNSAGVVTIASTLRSSRCSQETGPKSSQKAAHNPSYGPISDLCKGSGHQATAPRSGMRPDS